MWVSLRFKDSTAVKLSKAKNIIFESLIILLWTKFNISLVEEIFYFVSSKYFMFKWENKEIFPEKNLTLLNYLKLLMQIFCIKKIISLNKDIHNFLKNFLEPTIFFCILFINVTSIKLSSREKQLIIKYYWPFEDFFHKLFLNKVHANYRIQLT